MLYTGYPARRRHSAAGSLKGQGCPSCKGSGFDTIVSDGAANGWNNIAGARQYETLIERFFADTELHTVFFHDHLFANSHQMHGVFGALIVEESGATFHSPRSSREIRRGTQAVIRRRNGTSFREFALFVHDFAFLFDADKNPLNPPMCSAPWYTRIRLLPFWELIREIISTISAELMTCGWVFGESCGHMPFL